MKSKKFDNKFHAVIGDLELLKSLARKFGEENRTAAEKLDSCIISQAVSDMYDYIQYTHKIVEMK